MPLLERARVEVYLPDLPTESYRNLLKAFNDEFTYTFGGCTIIRGLDGSYLSKAGLIIGDKINLIYSDLPLAFSNHAEKIAKYAGELKHAAFEALSEEAVLVTVTQIYHVIAKSG